MLLPVCLQSLVRTFPGMSDYPLPEGVKGLASVVVDSVNCCDTDVRKDLYQHVVLTGENGCVHIEQEWGGVIGGVHV